MAADKLNAFQGEAHRPFTLTGGKAAALLVHGFPGSPAEMRPIATRLNKAGWTARGMLLPGFGAEFEDIVNKRKEDWLGAINDELSRLRQEHETVILVGNSMGGALAIESTATSDNRPDALILFAPFWKINHIAWSALPFISLLLPQPQLFKYLTLDFDDPDVREGIHNFMPDADLDDPAVREEIRGSRIPVKMFAEIRRAGHAAYRHAAGVRVPSLVIQGAADELVRPELTQKLISRFRATVRYHEVEAEHNTVLPDTSAWEAVSQHIIEFAQKQRRA